MTTAAATTVPGQITAAPIDADRIDPARLVAFLAMCFGMFMAFLDIQVVSASLAEIQAGLAASSDERSRLRHGSSGDATMICTGLLRFSC